MRKHPSPDVNERLLTLVANSVVYGKGGRFFEQFGFSREELLPAIIKAIKQVAASSEETYEQYSIPFFNILNRLFSAPHNDPKTEDPPQTVLSCLASYLSGHAFLPLNILYFPKMFLVLNLMSPDRRNMVIANSMLRDKQKTCEFLTKYCLPIPSEEQMSACLDAYLRRNVSNLFNNVSQWRINKIHAFFNIVMNNGQYYTQEHHELILDHFPADFKLGRHSLCDILATLSLCTKNDACLRKFDSSQ